MQNFLKILRRFLPPYKKHLVLNILFNLLGSIFGVFSFILIQPVLEILFGVQEDVTQLLPFELNLETISHNFYYYATQLKVEYGAASTLLFVGFLFIITAVLKVGFIYLASISMIIIRNSVVRDIRKKIYEKILSLSLPFFTEERKGDIMSRMTNDVLEVENSVMNSLEMFFKNPILILIYLTAMIIMSWQLTLFVLVLLPISGYVIGKIGKSLKSHSLRGQKKIGELLSTIDETLGGLRIIKAFNAQSKMKNRFGEENNAYRKIMNKLQFRRYLAHPLSEIMGTITIIIVLWFGSTLVFSNTAALSAPAFISYLVLFYSIINPAKAFTNAFYSIQKGMAAMDRIDHVLRTDPDISEKAEAKPVKSFNDKIVFENVSFSYDGRNEVLRNIDIDISKGTTVALVGQSGAGKTTFADMLPRFFDVSDGRITLDGVDIRDLKINDLRGLMGNVNQDPILFNDTFFNNISFGVDKSKIEDVEQAAKVANADNFINASEKKYEQSIGDRGEKLSGGQRQRISIARAVLKNPPILILDEATSALDTESERLVQEALNNLMKDRTSIVIAHRLSTVKNADIICVFKEGEIIEKGKHDELLAKGGEYKKLYELQMLE